MSLAISCLSCSEKPDQPQEAPFIGRSELFIEDNRMSPEALWAMGHIGSYSLSPDGKKIVYAVTYYSVPQNKNNRELFVMNSNGSGNKQITHTRFSETEAKWIKNGTKIAFLSTESGSSQVWEMNPNGSGHRQLTHYDKDIEGFCFSPDGKKLLFISQVKTVKSTAEIYPDLPESSGIIVNYLMYKHWDEWKTTAPHPFVADFDGSSISHITDLLEGEPYESPLKPFRGIEQLAWSPDSKTIAYTCRKKTGKEYALSTNSDIYLYDVEKKETLDNITAGNGGYDTNPCYSPDGRYIAWLSMERDGYESDRNRLMCMELATGKKSFLSEAFESNVDHYSWSEDSRDIFFTGVWHDKSHIYRINLEERELTQITDGVYDYTSVKVCGDQLITKRHSMQMANEIYSVSVEGLVTQLTFENKHIYDQLKENRVEELWLTTTDGKKMLTWVIYPPDFNPNRKYPALLYCNGGPQSPVSQFWSFRWNFKIMADQGYIVVAPSRRGLPGFGMEWLEEISGDYGGQCMRDYLTAIDQVARESFVDEERLGCVGASFGGYSVYWLAGHHNKRFKAFIAHDGIFNMEQQYLETEEIWFANWDMGGAYWEKENRVAQRTFANSPHKFVDKWDTPILCIHGEKDYRILASQGMSAFNAAILRGVPAELLIYPDENHWVLKPQNGVLWQRTFFAWLSKWL
ncbi:MAG: S9 family peptidase [Bacteroides sp.]|nr:S9 family peptidase [Bacteroides sp.]